MPSGAGIVTGEDDACGALPPANRDSHVEFSLAYRCKLFVHQKISSLQALGEDRG